MEGIGAQSSPAIRAVRIGRWWFKNRSLSPLPLFALLLVLPPERALTASMTTMSILGILAAESMRLWAVGFAGSATRTRGDTVPQLVHAGPYRFVRNPLYVANILLYTFCGFLFGFVYLALAIFIYSSLQYTFIVAFEEDTLARTFGDAYFQYQRKVSRWFFSVVPTIESSGQAFSFPRALRSERGTMFSIAAMGLFYVIKRLVMSQ
jgi:protein-S-isoprenylcysteine O-methyltransferase Ste14